MKNRLHYDVHVSTLCYAVRDKLRALESYLAETEQPDDIIDNISALIDFMSVLADAAVKAPEKEIEDGK